ncbi:MAG: HAD family hydrolase [Candidatus Pacebacteria bacterium]|nr:HAD family hydrolase [Candidatus Paceibacterota bacterium]
MSSRFELIVYTAANQRYADTIIDFIESKKKYFSHRLYTQQCLQNPGVYTYKYLDLLCDNRDIQDVVLVDNSIRNFALSIRNGIPIKDFLGNDLDTELIFLAKYMRQLADVEDGRTVIKEDFAAFLLEHSHAS